MKLNELIEKYGEYEVKEGFLNQLEKPKPKTIYDLKKGDGYYGITDAGRTFFMIWENEHINENHLEIGNVFLTQEEAEFELERLKVVAKLKKYARPFVDGIKNYFIILYGDSDRLDSSFNYHQRTDILYFDSDEDIYDAIVEIGDGDYDKGEALVKKYYLRVGNSEV